MDLHFISLTFSVYPDESGVKYMAETLFLEERRRVILEQLKRDGRVSVKELSDHLNVSAVTIRQDLRALEDEGLLERTYGGAMARTVNVLPEVAFEVRREANRSEKSAMGKAAAALVQEGYGIALDASTTAFALAAYLRGFHNLTVVTNSLMIAQQFLDNPRIEVILPGGKLRRDSASVVGNPNSLPNINLTIGFFSARGLSMDAGLTDISPEQAEIKKALLARCLTAVALIDSSKWGQVLPYTYAPIQKMSRIITTDKTAPEMIAQFRAVGVMVDIIDTEAG
jgi:DeoR/GlpR family transcriptional regulator of sugar metabolism